MLRAQLGPTLSLTFPTIVLQLTLLADEYGAESAYIVAELLLLVRTVVDLSPIETCPLIRARSFG